jgi:hypothetical protein
MCFMVFLSLGPHSATCSSYDTWPRNPSWLASKVLLLCYKKRLGKVLISSWGVKPTVRWCGTVNSD